MTKFSAHTIVHDGLTSHSFAPGDEVPGWAFGHVGEHVLEPEEHTETENSGSSGASDESGSVGQADDARTGDKELGGDEKAEGDGQDSTPPPTDDQPDFTTPAPARRNSRSRN